MKRSARQSDLADKRARVHERVASALGDGPICDRCGATFKTMNEVCTEELLDPCPGFRTIDAVQVPIEREIFGF